MENLFSSGTVFYSLIYLRGGSRISS